MKPVLLIIVALALTLGAYASAIADKPDPLFGNYVIGNSAEIVYLWPGNPNSDSMFMRNLDFTDFLTAAGLHPLTQSQDYSDAKMGDIASGDFDGDGDDDIVAAYWTNIGYSQQFRLVFPRIADGTIDWANAYTIDRCCVNGWMPGYRFGNIRLAVGNFDDDYKDEFAVAYWDANNLFRVRIEIWEFNQENNPVMLSAISCDNVDINLVDAVRFEIATGDFNGDKVDEIIMAFSKYVNPDDFRLAARVYQYNYSLNSIIPKAYTDTLFTYNPEPINDGLGDFIERIAVTTGDYNNDLRDEAAVAYQKRCGEWTWGLFSKWEYSTYTYFYLQTMRISQNLDTIAFDKSHCDLKRSGWEKHKTDQANIQDYFISGRSLGLASGDLNLDGWDEIIWDVFNEVRLYECDASLDLHPGPYITRSPKWYDFSTHTVAIADMNVNTNDTIWKAELVLHDWGGTSGKQRIRVCEAVYDANKDFTSIQVLATYKDMFSFEGQMALAVGDFNGDGLRLGPPTYITKSDVSQPLVVLNAPPIHFDLFGNDTCDINACFNNQDCHFVSTYKTDSAAALDVLSEVKTDWALGASISGETNYMGVGIKANFGMHYGENFSRIEGNTHTVHIGNSISANNYDRILASKTDYEIWEYPVYVNGIDTGRIAVVKPSVPSETWYSTENWKATSYFPNHEVSNLLSYKDYSDIEMQDRNVDILIKQAQECILDVSSEYHPYLRVTDVAGIEELQSRNIGIEMGASISGWGIEVGVTGSYDKTELSTQKTTITNAFSLETDIYGLNSGFSEAAYNIIPYYYWSEYGALVIDYSVNFDMAKAETWWDFRYGGAPDLAFSLPWRYHPEKGYPLTVDSTKRIKTFDIFVIPEKPDPLQVVTIAARIQNFSLVDCSQDIAVRFYNGDPDFGGTLITGTDAETEVVITGGINARGYEWCYLEWIVPYNIPQESRIYAVIDPDNAIDEIHQNNNKGWIKFDVPNGTPTEIADDYQNDLIPATYELFANYPNPFNPVTTFEYSLPTKSDVEISIYNILGRKVITLVNQSKNAGYHSVQWYGKDSYGQNVASGIYLYQIKAGDFTATRKMMLLK